MEDMLQSLGLSKAEIALYQAVLKARQITPANLAKAIGIKRTTAYGMARGLVEKGLLIEDSTRRPRVFVPANAEAVEHAAELEGRRYLERKALLKTLGEHVSQAVAEESYPVPKITFVEGEKIDAFLRKRLPDWNESLKSCNETDWWGFQDHTFVEHFSPWIDWSWKHAFDGMGVKLLTNAAPAERLMQGKYVRRQTKFWGEATNFISSTWIVGEYVIMINTRQQPFYLVEMVSAPLAHDQREVFRNLWEMV